MSGREGTGPGTPQKQPSLFAALCYCSFLAYAVAAYDSHGTFHDGRKKERSRDRSDTQIPLPCKMQLGKTSQLSPPGTLDTRDRSLGAIPERFLGKRPPIRPVSPSHPQVVTTPFFEQMRLKCRPSQTITIPVPGRPEPCCLQRNFQVAKNRGFACVDQAEIRESTTRSNEQGTRQCANGTWMELQQCVLLGHFFPHYPAGRPAFQRNGTSRSGCDSLRLMRRSLRGEPRKPHIPTPPITR